jgi:hypothetical protein
MRRESDCRIVPMKQGNACGRKAATLQRPWKGDINCTQRQEQRWKRN